MLYVLTLLPLAATALCLALGYALVLPLDQGDFFLWVTQRTGLVYLLVSALAFWREKAQQGRVRGTAQGAPPITHVGGLTIARQPLAPRRVGAFGYLMRFVVLGIFWVVGCSFLLAWVNSSRDISVPIRVETTIGKKYSGKNFSRTLTVDDWDHPGQRLGIPVNSSAFDAVAVGDRIALQVKPGHLGFRWKLSQPQPVERP